MRRTTALLALVMLLVADLSARAQSGSPATATAPPTQPAAVPELAPVGPPPAAVPPSLAPSLAPEPTAAPPPLVLDQRTQTADVPRPRPFYRKAWFWGAVGVVLATTAFILVASAGSAGPGTPATDLGNMHAF